jgi:ribonuclease E
VSTTTPSDPTTPTEGNPAEGNPAEGTMSAPRRRRATRTAAAPVAAAPALAPEIAAVEQQLAAPAEPATVEPPAEPAAPTRARRTRKAASDDAPAPARRSTRGRAAAKPAPAPAEAAVPDEAPAGSEPDPEADVVADEADETLADGEVAPEAADEQAGSRLPMTALLFQAPDLSTPRPRRRRAQVGAGSPEEISQATRHAERPSGDAVAAAAGADEVVESDETAAEAPAEAPAEGASEPRSRSRRRRGGRRQGGAAETTDDAAEPVDVAAAEAAEQGEPDEPADDEAEDGTEGAEGAGGQQRRRRRRGGRGRRSRTEGGEQAAGSDDADSEGEGAEASDDTDAPGEEGEETASRRRRRRRRGSRGDSAEADRPRTRSDEVTALRGSTRLEAKRQRRREGRDAGRRRQVISEAEFLARRESVERVMVVRERGGRTQIAVLEDGVLVEHYVSNQAAASMVGNVYLGRVQNVLPSMEAAFVDVGKGRNAVLYAGEVNWDAAGLEGQPRRIEQALRSGDAVLVQVTKDPIGHKGARLTSQVTLAGRYLVLVPGGGMTGISRKLPDTERNRLKRILRDIVPDSAGVIVRTAAEGASEDELRADIERLQAQWAAIEAKSTSASAPALLQGEPDMSIRVVRDIFNDDFSALVVQGDEAWDTISGYIGELAPDLAAKVSRWTSEADVFAAHRVDEQLAKGLDRKVWLPSGGSLVIDRTEAMTVIDVNTGKFTGAGGTLEETVTRNNLEAAEEIVRQLRLRDIGGIIVVDFIDMVLESNRDLVLRRLVECLGRDRTKHQVAEVTSLGLVQMTRKRVGQGLIEAFSETCEHCHGRGYLLHVDPVERGPRTDTDPVAPAPGPAARRSRRKRDGEGAPGVPVASVPVLPEAREAVKATLATIAAAAAHAHEHEHRDPAAEPLAEAVVEAVDAPVAESAGAVEEVVVEDIVVAVAPDEPAAPPALDVFAELAARPPAASRRSAPEAEPVGVDVELSLTPVGPEVFATEVTVEPDLETGVDPDAEQDGEQTEGQSDEQGPGEVDGQV